MRKFCCYCIVFFCFQSIIFSFNLLSIKHNQVSKLLRKGFKLYAGKGVEEGYVCEECGTEHIKWVGRCTSCKAWNTIKPFRKSKLVNKLDSRTISSGIGSWITSENKNQQLQKLSEIGSSESFSRLEIFSSEFNRVIGGGLVKGSVVLLVGEPGIGKSTILLQLAASVGERDGTVVYLSGEENPQQIAMRSRRMDLKQSSILLICDVTIDQVISEINNMETPPSLLIVDSIQTMSTESCPGNIGTTTQIRESTSKLVQFAKSSQIPVILIGHVTKSGDVAGPKVLEHMVDTVLTLEGSESNDYRIIRCDKNRFGSVSEIGVFSMTENGMKDVSNPSELFLTDNVLKEPQEGSAVMATSEGSRTLLAEVQCLVTANHYSTNSMRPSSPKRTSGGFPIQRLLLLCAVIEKRLRLPLWNRDIFLNIVGGLTISEPSADLAVLVSIVSSLLSKPIKVGTAFIGEVGLGGELRNTKKIEQKIMEAIKLGFRRVIVPKISIKQQVFDQVLDKTSGIKSEITPCANVFEAIENGLLLNGKTLLEARHAFRGNKKSKRQNDDFSSIEPDFNEDDQLDIDQNID